MTELPVVTVVALYGGLPRLLACSLGIHRRARKLVTDAYGGPAFLDYCPSCGAADPDQWEWAGSTHQGSVSLVSYRPRGTTA